MALRRADGVASEVVEGRAFLVDARGAELITLNPVGTLVWESLDGSRDVTELAEHLVDRFKGVTSEQLEADIRRFLDELLQLRLVAS